MTSVSLTAKRILENATPTERGTVVRTLVFDRRTFLSNARPAADGWPLMWDCG